MPKKIIQISPYSFDHPGGVEQYARTLQEIFPDDMMTFAGGEDFAIIEPVMHCPLPCFWRAWFWKIFDSIQSANTSMIISHIRFAPTSWLAFWIAKQRKIPYIHIEHGTGFLVHKNPLIAGIAKLIDLTIGKYIIRQADRVICVSEAGKKWVNTTFGRTEGIDVIYRGFDFPKVERRHNAIKKVGFVGRLTGLKNVSSLIEALAELREEKWILEIVWDGEERENLEKLSESLSIENRIIFHGAKSHDWIMTEFYPGIDIFVNPSLQEWLPTTVIEALGMGCQVIATDVGGTREIGGIILIDPEKSSLKQSLNENLWNPDFPSVKKSQFTLESMREKCLWSFSYDFFPHT